MAVSNPQKGQWVVYESDGIWTGPFEIICVLENGDAVSTSGMYMELSDGFYRRATGSEIEERLKENKPYAKVVSEMFSGLRSQLDQMEKTLLGVK